MNSSRSISILACAALFASLICAPRLCAQQRTPADRPSSAEPKQTRADAEKDPVLAAMLTELDRSMSHLQLNGFAKPFFIQYRIEEVDDFNTQAEFGSSEGSEHTHERVARVTVCVGDYKTDSSGARGGGAVELTALENDPIALRSSLWAATDQAYKNALSAYAQKQAELKQVQTPPQADDFSHEKPVVSLAEPVILHLDEDEWAQRVARMSGLYRTDATVVSTTRTGVPNDRSSSLGWETGVPNDRSSSLGWETGVPNDSSSSLGWERNVEYSNASFRARSTTTWLITSEGTIVRKSAAEYQEAFVVGTQAADGMRLDRSYASTGPSLADLDSEAAFNRHAAEEIASLVDLRKAPLVEEEYHGPLLMSADAAADTLHSLLASAVTATRPALGTEARTNGPFASSYHARVLPDFMSVFDDPGLTTFSGKGLLGAYSVDDEGVPAQAVKLVEAGRLGNYLIGREPVRDFPQSNGHARAGITGAARPMIGVLKITAENGLTTDDLNQKLLAMAKDRGLPSVYFVETLGGAGTPRLLYRITPEGKRELVRGAVLADIDGRALRSSVEAAGKDLWVANYFGEAPVTVLAPALLFDDATVRRANEKNEKLPFYPPPE